MAIFCIYLAELSNTGSSGSKNHKDDEHHHLHLKLVLDNLTCTVVVLRCILSLTSILVANDVVFTLGITAANHINA